MILIDPIYTHDSTLHINRIQKIIKNYKRIMSIDIVTLISAHNIFHILFFNLYNIRASILLKGNSRYISHNYQALFVSARPPLSSAVQLWQRFKI